jgi:hypothetical protein
MTVLSQFAQRVPLQMVLQETFELLSRNSLSTPFPAGARPSKGFWIQRAEVRPNIRWEPE